MSTIIGIHGLSNKPPKEDLEAGWRAAIQEGLLKNEGVEREVNFKLVYWAELMYPSPDENPESYRTAEAGAIRSYREGWLDHVRKNSFGLAGNVIDSINAYYGFDGLATAVLQSKLPDLYRYYNDVSVQQALRGRLRAALLDNVNQRVMVIAHSMGSIIAYDVLRDIGKTHPHVSIDHCVTIGSPLGMPHVRYKIALEDANVRTPSVVNRWTNFADRRDPVAIDTHLADDYGPNSYGVQVSDDLVSNDWGGIYHKSYGYLRTPEVSRSIREFL